MSSIIRNLTLALTVVSLSACAGWLRPSAEPAPSPAPSTASAPEVSETGEAREQQLRQNIARLEAQLEQERRRQRGQATEQPQQNPALSLGALEGMPLEAKPGECYAQVAIPPKFETRTEQRLLVAARERVEVIPAQYEWVEEQVLVRPAYERVVDLQPAQYRWVEEKVLVKPAGERVIEIPATYRWVEERILVKPASKVWKPGRGPVERVDSATGEIMCLVEVPAEYKTVRRRVVDTPPSTRTEQVPAEYKTIKRQELVSEARMVKQQVPAEYETVRKQKLVTPAREIRRTIPAEYETVETTVKVSDGTMEWRGVLCEVNATRETIADLQRALAAAGYSPGKIDGVLGRNTLRAAREYQIDNNLAQGGITLEMVRKLGLRI